MERLNDDELFTDVESVEKEIKKAQALSSLAEQVVSIKQVEVNDKQANIEAMKTAYDMGYEFKPDGMKLTELPPIGVKNAIKRDKYRD